MRVWLGCKIIDKSTKCHGKYVHTFISSSKQPPSARVPQRCVRVPRHLRAALETCESAEANGGRTVPAVTGAECARPAAKSLSPLLIVLVRRQRQGEVPDRASPSPRAAALASGSADAATPRLVKHVREPELLPLSFRSHCCISLCFCCAILGLAELSLCWGKIGKAVGVQEGSVSALGDGQRSARRLLHPLAEYRGLEGPKDAIFAPVGSIKPWPRVDPVSGLHRVLVFARRAKIGGSGVAGALRAMRVQDFCRVPSRRSPRRRPVLSNAIRRTTHRTNR